MQTQERPLGQRILRGLFRFIATLFVIALVGLVAYLASERNARIFTVQKSGDQLIVMKGKLLPTGAQPWQPGDTVLADTYAPIPLDGTPVEPSLLQRQFQDRDELDRALFSVLESLARPRVQSDDPKRLERGVYYLRRAEKLTGLSSEQRTTLEALRSDVALYLARLKLDQARQTLAEALSQLQVAATGQNKNAQKANQLAAQIAGPARDFEDRLSKVLAELPATPAPQEEPLPGTTTAPTPSPEPAPAPTSTPTPAPAAADAGTP